VDVNISLKNGKIYHLGDVRREYAKFG